LNILTSFSVKISIQKTLKL